MTRAEPTRRSPQKQQHTVTKHKMLVVPRRPTTRRPATRGRTVAVIKAKPKPKPKRIVRRRRARPMTGPFQNFTRSDPFPQRKNVRLTYTHNYQLSTANSSPNYGSQQMYNLNSVYDPDATGAGHQPYGFDQMATLYQRYKVNAVLIDFYYTAPSEDAIVVAAQINNNTNYTASIAGLNPEVVRERTMAVSRVVNSTGSQTTRIRQYIPIYKALGWTKQQVQVDHGGLTAGVGGSPSSLCSVVTAAASLSASTTQTIHVRAQLTYYVTFFERHILSQS